jgi:surface antigen
MRTVVSRYSKRAAVVALTLTMALVGCSTMEGTGQVVGGGIGAAGGAAGGAAIAKHAGAGNAGVAAAAVGGAVVGGALGALIGGKIGAVLDDREKQQMTDTTKCALQKSDGTPCVVRSETHDRNLSAQVVRKETPTTDGHPCNNVRQIVQPVYRGGKETAENVSLCQTADGSWVPRA